MAGSIRYQNYPISVWTVTAQRLKQYTSSTVVFYHGHTCQSFRDVTTTSGDTLAARYERTISRLEQKTREGYQVKIEWEREFVETGIVRQKPELLNHPIVRQSPLRTRDALYRGHASTLQSK